MAWTTPKTWVNQDPMNESNLNTYIRDNQVALRADTEDAKIKVGKMFPTWQSPQMVGYAVIGIGGVNVTINSNTFVVWHENLKLTFTPKTDLVLFGVHLSYRTQGAVHKRTNFGLRKGNSNVSLAQTAVLAGALGSNDHIVEQENFNLGGPQQMSYQAPVSVTRNEEVTIAPTVAVEPGVSVTLWPTSMMMLTALDVGAYE